MFLLGCAGDSDPYPRTAPKMPVGQARDYSRQHGAELSREVERVLGGTAFAGSGQGGKLKPVAGPLRVAYGTTELPLEAGGSVTGRVAVWQFGEDLTLVALAGEVVVDYVALIERALGPTRLWVSAYSNDVFGYLPSARLIPEGGYETRRGFSAKAQDALVAKVRELAGAAGRALP
jgi:neutral ceramidase